MAHIGLESFTSARDLFEAARAAAHELGRERLALEAMEAREGARGAGAGVGRPSGIGDPYRATDARMDHEARMRESIEADEAIIDLACAVLYGWDYTGRTGGLYSLVPHECADVLCMVYCQNMTWEQAGDALKYSARTCQRRAALGFDVMEAYGLEACAAGRLPD